MLQILKDSNFDFMKLGRPLLMVAMVFTLISVVLLFVLGINRGIEFTGGTELQIKYATTPDVGEVRAALLQAGLTSTIVTTIGDPSENEIYIRIGTEDDEESTDLTTLVGKTLRAGSVQEGRIDVNVADLQVVEQVLLRAPAVSATDAVDIAERIIDRRKDVAIFGSTSDLQTIEGVTPPVLTYMEEQAYAGPLAVRSQSYVYPAVGEELQAKARMAITFSLLMMMLYIWIRFQLMWGFAAVFALTHDTLITLGLFSIFQMEMSLPVVAAFLTLVGYSVNDTVVVFDRIRENLRGRSGSLTDTINLSINQTLSRTVITSGLTFIVVFGLYLFGGSALRSFSFVLSVGVVVGTFSSIYIASPLLVLFTAWVDRYKQNRSGASTRPRPIAKKVRGT